MTEYLTCTQGRFIICNTTNVLVTINHTNKKNFINHAHKKCNRTILNLNNMYK